ncbi:hypothetical protein K466DRAFT_598970 [Polyporus arcularius HHB13444]|uniref:Uncharacterized protein n=1 Tax=Polyporus arcularius HHB13444 TaxID=1314778 RepID=A0A5C3PFH1_9APHY|nr:hypothetical protein K466DRAFT_598970 [Polyporus arcularius HHB13444]
MANCARCQALVNEEHIPDADCHTYNPGDIIAIQDSVHVPIFHHVLNNRQRDASSRRGSNLSNGSRVWVDNGRGGRPAIVLEHRPIESPDGNGRTAPSNFFCIAVYPHSTIAEDEAGVFHLHTSPEWSHSKKDATDLHGWLIARQFTSTKPTKGRWKNANRSSWDSESSFTIDHETRMKLLEIVEEKWDEWVASCEQDPQRLYTYRNDYCDFRNKLHHYNPSSPSRTRNATPSARSPSVTSPIDRGVPLPSPLTPWATSATRNPANTLAHGARGAPVQGTANAPMPIVHAGNGSARPAAKPSSPPTSSVPANVPVAAGSSTVPGKSAPQSAWSRPAAPRMADGSALPSTTGPLPASDFPSLPATAQSRPAASRGPGTSAPTSAHQVANGSALLHPASKSLNLAPTPQVAQNRSPAQPSFAQAVVRGKKQAGRGAGAGQQRPPRN